MFKLFFNSLVGNPIEKEVSRKCLLVYNKLPSISLKKLFLPTNCSNLASAYLQTNSRNSLNIIFHTAFRGAFLSALSISAHLSSLFNIDIYSSVSCAYRSADDAGAGGLCACAF